ncbi:MAG: hypothetical protein H6Q37_523, partial [Chloroflexi bacterium]|nr:hypothetical protein [Chloroflexota bacterium]
YPEGLMPTDLPNLGSYARIGKIAIWLPYLNIPDWPDKLIEVLETLSLQPESRS